MGTATNRRWLVLGLGALVTAGLVGAGAARAANEAPPDRPRPSSAAHEASISEVADRLTELGGTHFAGLTIDREHQVIVSHWTQGIPVSVARYARTKPAGVAIELRENAPYSREQLADAAGRVVQSEEGRAAHVSMVAVAPDGSGLEVDVEQDVPDASAQAAIAAVAGLPAGAITWVPHRGVKTEPGVLR